MKLQAKSKLSIDDLIAQGYCRVSNKHLTVARIDRADWKEFMAKEHAVWDPEGEGQIWVASLLAGSHAADHYRRCYSNDKIVFDKKAYPQFKLFPGSGDLSAPQEFVGADRRAKEYAMPVPPPSKLPLPPHRPLGFDPDLEEMAHSEGYVAGEHGATASDNPKPLGYLHRAWEAGRQEAIEEFEQDCPYAHGEVDKNLKATGWLFAGTLILLAVYGIFERIF